MSDLSERRLRAAEDALTEMYIPECALHLGDVLANAGVPVRMVTVALGHALAASDAALATATSEEVFKSAVHDAATAYVNESGQVESQRGLRAALRAASAILLAPLLAQLEYRNNEAAALSKRLGEIDDELAAEEKASATLCQENARLRETCPYWGRLFQYDGDATKALDHELAILRQRAESAEQRAVEMQKALQHIASWGEGATVTNSFDEPEAATIARAALTRPASGGEVCSPFCSRCIPGQPCDPECSVCHPAAARRKEG